MRTVLLSLFVLASFVGHAQKPTPVSVPAKAVVQLEKMLKKTQTEVVVGKQSSTSPAETRPALNKILVQSTSEFLAITGRNPTKEAYMQSLDAGLNSITPLVPETEDREQVAEYYQDLLDIVGLESSEGRLTAFVAGRIAQR